MNSGFCGAPNIGVVVSEEFRLHFPDPGNWADNCVAVASTADGYPRLILINLVSGHYEIIEYMARDPLWHTWLSLRLAQQVLLGTGPSPIPDLIGMDIVMRHPLRNGGFNIDSLTMNPYPGLGLAYDGADWSFATFSDCLFDNFLGAVQQASMQTGSTVAKLCGCGRSSSIVFTKVFANKRWSALLMPTGFLFHGCIQLM